MRGPIRISTIEPTRHHTQRNKINIAKKSLKIFFLKSFSYKSKISFSETFTYELTSWLLENNWNPSVIKLGKKSTKTCIKSKISKKSIETFEIKQTIKNNVILEKKLFIFIESMSYQLKAIKN